MGMVVGAKKECGFASAMLAVAMRLLSHEIKRDLIPGMLLCLVNHSNAHEISSST